MRPVTAHTPAHSQADRELLERLVRTRWGQAPRSIERLAAGLGQRRFYRILFNENDSPVSLIARIEASPESPEAARQTANSAPAWLPEPPLEPLRGFLENAGLPVPSRGVLC